MPEKIAVLMGGRSLEREVSLKSGERVAAALESRGYRVVALDLVPGLVESIRNEKPDAAYIALHGKFGEDGTIQELLEFLRIPYTGPGVFASALAWDKAISKRLYAEHGVPTPLAVSFSASAIKEMGAAAALDLVPAEVGGFPVAVKPARQGSSLGLAKVDGPDDLPEAMLTALSFDDKVIVEKWIDGTVLAVSVLERPDGMIVLPPVEIVMPQGGLDYRQRYVSGEAECFVPARLSSEADYSAREVAERVHVLTGCRDVSRVDMIIDRDGTPYVLECNTSPGMTDISWLPMAAEAAGLDFAEVVDGLVRAALERGPEVPLVG